MIIDKLYERVRERGHVCVGLDTALEYIPDGFKNRFGNEEDALFEFNREIIDSTFDAASCFKVQIAYYEALGIKGLRAYKRTLEYLRAKGELVIADIKRGDIAATAKMYAKAHFTGDFESDFITLSPYMGMDSIEPYLEYVGNREKGIFALIRTSNKGAEDIQYLEDSRNKKIYSHVGERLYEMGEKYLGKCGYSSLGGVMGCTHIDEGIKIRNEFKNMFFLIPGYGAQGGGAEDVGVYLRDGNGGVVNSSRGILLAYKKHEDGTKNFSEYARNEVLRMREEILSAANVQGK